VNSSTFLTLIEKGNDLQKEDLHQLVKLHEAFPFFQIPMVLAAKHEHSKSTNKKEMLHWAASLSPDRAWLKHLLENRIDFLQTYEEKESPSSSIISPTEEQKVEDKPDLVDAQEALSDDKDKPELVSSPEEIQEEEPKADLIKSGTDASQEELPKIAAGPEEDKPIIEPSPILPHTKVEILQQLEESLPEGKSQPAEGAKPAESEKNKPATSEKKKNKRRGATDEILDSIKKKEKKEIKDTRKKEHNDIIKAFSKKSIKLAAIRENEDVNKLEDLSKDSTKVNDRLVSESYAKLLTRQGKTDAAKEIYQKLILKFPQKKAYFADLLKQLED